MSQESRIKRGRTPDRQQKGSRGFALGQTFCSDEAVLGRPLCPKLRKKTETSEDDEYDDGDIEQQEDPVDCHVCATCLAQDEYDCMEDQIEQDAVTCFVAARADIADRGTAEDILRCVHTELFEFYAMGLTLQKTSTQRLAEIERCGQGGPRTGDSASSLRERARFELMRMPRCKETGTRTERRSCSSDMVRSCQ